MKPADNVGERIFVTGGENVRPAVVVVIECPAGEAIRRSVDAHRGGHVGESAVAVVVIERSRTADRIDEQVWKAVIVEVDPGGAAPDPRTAFDSAESRLLRGVLERAVAFVAIEPALLRSTRNEEIEET